MCSGRRLEIGKGRKGGAIEIEEVAWGIQQPKAGRIVGWRDDVYACDD